MRAFIAVGLSKDVRFKIEEVINYFKTKTPLYTLNWVSPEHLHLTIKFIGEIEEDKIEALQGVMLQSLEHQPSFEIEICGLGMYPNKNRPRVIWLGINGGEPLVTLHKIFDKKMVEFGIQRDDRPFSPHLTIARVRRNVDLSTVKSIGTTLSEYNVESLGIVNIGQVNLYKSVLMPSGPIYSTLFSVPLNQV